MHDDISHTFDCPPWNMAVFGFEVVGQPADKFADLENIE